MVAHFIVMIRMVHLAQPYWHCTVYSTLCTLCTLYSVHLTVLSEQ